MAQAGSTPHISFTIESLVTIAAPLRRFFPRFS
jgi:hypothetical protein